MTVKAMAFSSQMGLTTSGAGFAGVRWFWVRWFGVCRLGVELGRGIGSLATLALWECSGE